MLKVNIQLFAHKKGMGSTKNGRDSESKRPAIFWSSSAAPRSIPAPTWAAVPTIPCLR